MKEKEMPEKIYINPNLENRIWLIGRGDISFIKYVRADVLIERACEYFRRSLEDTKVVDDYRNILVRGIQARYISVEEFIEDFRNYIKEE